MCERQTDQIVKAGEKMETEKKLDATKGFKNEIEFRWMLKIFEALIKAKERMTK